MKPFNYYQPTDIIAGDGRLKEAGVVVARYGKRCLLVTGRKDGGRGGLYERILSILKDAKLEPAHFEGVQPYAAMNNVAAGAAMAKELKADVVLGVGGGSTIDVAKGIAVQATHSGSACDFVWNGKKQPTAKTLPIVAIPTTSGTGTHVTQAALLTGADDGNASMLRHPNLFPRGCIVDPELTLSLPRRATASTGWHAFANAFESYVSANASYHTEMVALKALRLAATNLERAIEDGTNVEVRARLCWADTLAGMCVANTGTLLPHAMAQPIASRHRNVSYGEVLAAVYPAFTRFTVRSGVEKFAAVGRIVDHTLNGLSDKSAAAQTCDAIDAFLRRIGLWSSLDSLQVPEEATDDILDQCMQFPDGEANPRPATRDEIADLLRQSRNR